MTEKLIGIETSKQTNNRDKNVLKSIPYVDSCYPPTKSEGYSFGVVRPSIPSVRTFCLSRTKSQYLLVRYDSFLVQMISTMDSRYPISWSKSTPEHLSYCRCFSIGNYNAKPILAFFV